MAGIVNYVLEFCTLEYEMTVGDQLNLSRQFMVA